MTLEDMFTQYGYQEPGSVDDLDNFDDSDDEVQSNDIIGAGGSAGAGAAAAAGGGDIGVGKEDRSRSAPLTGDAMAMAVANSMFGLSRLGLDIASIPDDVQGE